MIEHENDFEPVRQEDHWRVREKDDAFQIQNSVYMWAIWIDQETRVIFENHCGDYEELYDEEQEDLECFQSKCLARLYGLGGIGDKWVKIDDGEDRTIRNSSFWWHCYLDEDSMSMEEEEEGSSEGLSVDIRQELNDFQEQARAHFSDYLYDYYIKNNNPCDGYVDGSSCICDGCSREDVCVLFECEMLCSACLKKVRKNYLARKRRKGKKEFDFMREQEEPSTDQS